MIRLAAQENCFFAAIILLAGYQLRELRYPPIGEVDPNRFIFKDRIVNFTNSLIISIVSLGVIYLGLRMFVFFVIRMLAKMPV